MANACPPGNPSQNWVSSHTAFDYGRMDGFVRASGEVAMGYWDDRIFPFYYSLAAHFPVCDRYFCSTLCQTYPNRVFAMAAMAATAAGLTATLSPPPEVHPPNGHIFDVLEGHGIGWADCLTDLPSPGLFGRAWALQRLGRNLVGPGGTIDGTLAAVEAAITTGTLPPVVMIETQYQYASEENPGRGLYVRRRLHPPRLPRAVRRGLALGQARLRVPHGLRQHVCAPHQRDADQTRCSRATTRSMLPSGSRTENMSGTPATCSTSGSASTPRASRSAWTASVAAAVSVGS